MGSPNGPFPTFTAGEWIIVHHPDTGPKLFLLKHNYWGDVGMTVDGHYTLVKRATYAEIVGMTTDLEKLIHNLGSKL